MDELNAHHVQLLVTAKAALNQTGNAGAAVGLLLTAATELAKTTGIPIDILLNAIHETFEMEIPQVQVVLTQLVHGPPQGESS